MSAEEALREILKLHSNAYGKCEHCYNYYEPTYPCSTAKIALNYYDAAGDTRE
jgi:hypothetical protein